MEDLGNLDERKPIWIALSELYLDTELDDPDFKYIAKTILQSPYTFEEVRKIDKYEIFPILFSNLLVPAGQWAGFDEKILIDNIIQWRKSKSPLDILAVQCIYPFYERVNKDYWNKVKNHCDEIRSGS